MNSVDVSVIIPTYNRLQTLGRAINSCQAKCCKVEIIVVDDGSTDGTWEWLQTQPQLIALRQRNQGQAWAVLNGFKVSRGNYIRFLDSDDFLDFSAIDIQWNIARSSGADLVYGAVDRYLESSKKVLTEPDPGEWDDFLAVQLGEPNGSHYLGMLFHRKLFDQIPVRRPEFSFRDDRILLLEVGLRNPKTRRSSGVAGYWSKHSAQMHINYQGPQLVVAAYQLLEIYKFVIQELINRQELTPRRAAAACNVLWPLAHQLAYTHPAEGAEIADWVSILCPSFQHPEKEWLGWCYSSFGFRNTERLLHLRRRLLRLLGKRGLKTELRLPRPLTLLTQKTSSTSVSVDKITDHDG